MVKKTYSVTLNEETVEEAQSFLNDSGAKLSPVLNNLLLGWIERQKEIEKLENTEEEEEEEE